LQRIEDGIWTLEHPFSMPGGIQIGTRSTWVRLTDGTLLLHAPGPLTRAHREAAAEIGPVSVIVAPNAFHHLYVAAAVESFPGATLYAAPSLGEKLSGLSSRSLRPEPDPSWADVLQQEAVGGMPRMDEWVFFHGASGTLLLVDLCFNMQRFGNRRTGWFMRLAGAYARFGPSRLARSMMKDRAALRASLERIFAWDFDRVVVTHGDIVDTGGKSALREAFASILG